MSTRKITLEFTLYELRCDYPHYTDEMLREQFVEYMRHVVADSVTTEISGDEYPGVMSVDLSDDGDESSMAIFEIISVR